MSDQRSSTQVRRTLRSLDAIVGSQIGALRQREGMTQKALAEKIGERQSTIARIELGKQSITIEKLLRISWALDVAPAFLLAASFQPADVPVTAKIKLSPRDAFEWIIGDQHLPGEDERAYNENVSDEIASDRRALAELGRQLKNHKITITGPEGGS